MSDPELLLLDEPVSGLDPGAREALIELLVSISGRVDATCMVTHHVEDIPPTSTHALLLRSGAVLAAGLVDEVLTPAALSRCFGIDLRSSGATAATGPAAPDNPLGMLQISRYHHR